MPYQLEVEIGKRPEESLDISSSMCADRLDLPSTGACENALLTAGPLCTTFEAVLKLEVQMQIKS
jgi:hypothetical protein